MEQSRQILYLLADLEDRSQQDRNAEVRERIANAVDRSEGEQGEASEDASQQSQPLRLARSMLGVAASLAGEMLRPAAAMNLELETNQQ